MLLKSYRYNTLCKRNRYYKTFVKWIGDSLPKRFKWHSYKDENRVSDLGSLKTFSLKLKESVPDIGSLKTSSLKWQQGLLDVGSLKIYSMNWKQRLPVASFLGTILPKVISPQFI